MCVTHKIYHYENTMKRLYFLCICLMLGSLFCQLVYISRLSRKESSLHNEIRQELEHLSVDFSETRISIHPFPTNLSQCQIPTNIQTVCIDTIEHAMSPPFCPLRELFQDCSLLKQLHAYDKMPDEEERHFPLAFGIKMHKNPEQAEQLLRALYRPHNIYCIHVDNKSDDNTFLMMTSLAACFPNVILTNRLNLVYGGPQMVEAELILMRCALQSAVPWKYYLNVAGQEFPLRTNLEMVRILKMLNGSNDIASVPMPTHLQGRISHVYKVNNGRMVKTTTRKEAPPFQTDFRKGTQYGAFSRSFVSSLFQNDAAKSIIAYFSDTYSSDEIVWATINAYSGTPGGYAGDVAHTPNNEHLSRAVAWEFSDSYVCQGSYVRRVCVFSKRDLPWLLKQPNLMANKFGEEGDSYQAVACLEAVLDQRVRSRGVTIEQSYVRNLPYMRFRRNALK